MIQQEILEYNKRCAEFLFPELIDIDDTDIWGLSRTLIKEKKSKYEILGGHWSNIFIDMHLKFHSDWNWIMEVVEAIDKMKFVVKIKTSPTISSKWIQHTITIQNSTIDSLLNCKFIVEYKSDYSNDETKKEAVVQAINKFLIWNEQNKP